MVIADTDITGCNQFSEANCGEKCNLGPDPRALNISLPRKTSILYLNVNKSHHWVTCILLQANNTVFAHITLSQGLFVYPIKRLSRHHNQFLLKPQGMHAMASYLLPKWTEALNLSCPSPMMTPYSEFHLSKQDYSIESQLKGLAVLFFFFFF